jgi:carbon monoxide dehydrogenase subunit G
MKIEKTFTVNAPQDTVWQFITSPEKVAPCIPGCEGAEQTGESTYKASIKVKVGPIKTRFVVDIETIEERPPEFASYMTKGEEGTKSSRLKASSTLALLSLEDGSTEVTYTSEINLLGRLGKFGSGMMQKVADSIGNEFVAGLKEQLEK